MHSVLKERKSFGETRCRKSCTQFKEFHSQSPRYVTRVSGRRKDHRLEKIQVKPRHQRSPYVIKFEVRSHEETARQQRCAQSKAWSLAQNMYKFKEKRQGCILFSRGGTGTPRLRQQESRRKESLWLIPVRVCIWSVRKTVTLLSWRP